MSTVCIDRPSEPTPARTRAHVVLVEDDDEMAQALCHVLERERYEVDLYADAGEALAAMQAGAAPDLIVLDLWTPTMNGWQFRLAQKQDPRLARVPLIAISADKSAHAAAIDADRFLPKPLTGKALLASVREVLAAPSPLPAPSSRDTWNALFMSLTDLRDARAHARQLVSELRGFPAARTIALDVLLERAELCTRHALAHRDAELPALDDAALRPRTAPLAFEDLGSFLAHVDPEALPARKAAPSDRWQEARLRHTLVDPLWVLARSLRTLGSLPAGLRFELEADDEVPVRADAGLLAQLLRNVLVNALEALVSAPEPALRVRSKRLPGFVELSIVDSGRGAMVRQLERAFDPFFSTKDAHLGLGLTVARRLAVRMEGRLELDREPGGGTVARLLLPTADSQQAELAPLPGRPALLLLHHPDRARRLQALLADQFHVVCMRPDEAIRHLLGGARYDLVLCALVMPEMTGISFVSALALAQPAQAERLVVMVPPDFGKETNKLLEQLHIWHVDEAQPIAELQDSLHGLLRLWSSLRFR